MNKNEKISKVKKLIYVSIGLIIVGAILFSLSLMGLNHTAIDQPISQIFRF